MLIVESVATELSVVETVIVDEPMVEVELTVVELLKVTAAA